MTDVLISTIIPIWKPNFNHLKKCLDSVLAQTYSNIEIILVYKKSPQFDDEFHNLINQYQDMRIKVIKDNNKGFSNALNLGIINSTGRLIARMDGDDFCVNNRFERQLKFKKNNKCDVVGTWACLLSEDGTQIGKIETPTTHEEIRKKMMLHDPILHPSVLMDRKMLDKIGLYDTSFVYAEDYELWFRAMSKNYKFRNVPEFLVNIRENPQSITRGPEWKKHRIFAMKAKNRAFLKYGFCKPQDIFYYILTQFTYFISPRMASRAKKLTGWYKT